MMGTGRFRQLLLTLVTTVICSSQAGEHSFLVLHDQSNKCLQVDNDKLKLGSCLDTSNKALWQWGSGHRLYSLESQKCLGLDLTKSQEPLKTVPCDSKLMLWWRCSGGHVYGASRYGLSLKNGTVTAVLLSSDEWKVNGTSENICEVPYHVVYTTGGNSYGKPCEFPFMFNGTWHNDCIYDTNEDREWCSTSGIFDTDGRWGNCLKPVSDCNRTWTQNSTLQQCYQFNVQASLRWKEAYMSCKSQGADLLSISSEEELDFITDKEDPPDFVWTGLNRLESASGWQWSDNSPLNFINWDEGITAFSVLDGSSCGRLNVNTRTWDAFPCDASLPYICKKPVNSSAQVSSDYWHYSETTCEGNSTAYNGFCYFLQKPDSWEHADLSCQKENASLISLHSLADIELVVTKFQNEKGNIWSGFRSDSFPHLYKWSDGTEAHFTYWDQNEPLSPFNVTPSCVCLSGTTGRWHVKNCTEKLISICKRPGKTKADTTSDSGCPQDQNWRRHGEYCYLVNKTEVTFDEKCNLTITNRFEQEFLNSLMREQANSEGKYFWTNLRDTNVSGDYYWQTAGGNKDLSYSNWNSHEPGFPGGCVVMAGGETLGKWEVKDCKSFKARSICKKGIGSAKEEDIPKPSVTTCPNGWFSGYDMYCFKVFHKERLLRQRTWEEAEGICEEFGGHLVSFAHIKDMKTFHKFLKSRLSSIEKQWIWVGLNKRNLGSWEWSDGLPISSIVLNEFQEDDYFMRDCAALEINSSWKKNVWTWNSEMAQEHEYSLQPFHCDAHLEWVCQVAKGADPKSPEWYQPAWKSKMGPSIVIDGSEYWFVSEPKLSHKEAELYCAFNGSELAVIDSYSAMHGIQDQLKTQGSERKENLLQKWWVKSAVFRSHHQLILHRVLGRHYHDCSFILALSFLPDYFHRVNCNERLPFICKSQNISLLEMETLKPNNYTGSCPLNWTAYENKCFIKVEPKYLKFSAANDYCIKYGGKLPSISSQSDQDFITYLSPGLSQKFWIGLRLTLNTAQNSWIDGSGVTYTNFNPLLQGRFKKFEYDAFDKEKNEQCVFFLNDPKSSFVGTWDFTACSDLQYVTICQRARDIAVKNGTVLPTVVPKDVEDVDYKENKYKIFQKNMTWYTALEECRSQNMELVSITDQYHLSFLIVTAKQTNRPFWIGLSSRDDGIHYRWQDGSTVTLSRWAEDEHEVEDCVFMDVDGTWRTKSCDDELPGAVCYVPANITEKKPQNHVICPHKVLDVVWIPYRNNCYAFLLNHKRWLSNEHRYICHSLHPDAYALSIRDEEENSFIFNELQPYMDLAKWVWLGIRYDGYENHLRWHDETFVKYSNWRTGRPNVTSSRFYAGVKLDGFWDIFLNPKDFELIFYQQHSIVACKIEMGSRKEFIEPLPTAIPFDNSTYYVLKKKLTWFEAVKECWQNGGNLASVHHNHQQLFLENIVRQDGFPLWIGLWNNDGSISGTEWSDGSSARYAFMYLDSLLSRGNCVYLDTKGTWKYKSCTDPLDGALCYKPLAGKSKSTATDSLCPKSDGSAQWVRQKDFCYAFDVKIYNYSVYTNEQASKMCQTLDPSAKLLTIDDDEENEYVSKYLTADTFITRRVWLGVDSKSADQKFWLDGTPIKYNNWSGKMWNMASCAVLFPETGTWNRVPCTSGLARIVCKSPLKSSGVGVAVGFAIFIILALIIGLVVYLYKRRHPLFFSSIRYRRAEDQMESMIDYS
ncbi:lymphocyte antigen 75-like [Mantella aurantiaca]